MYFWESLDSNQSNLFIVGERCLSYQQVAQLSDDIFRACEPRTIALIHCGQNIATILAYLGFLRKRIVPIMVPESVTPDMLAIYIERYRPRYLWSNSQLAVNLGHASISDYDDYRLIDLVRTDVPKIHADLAVLLPTSGTTGDPKLVRLSYDNIQANTADIIHMLNINSKHRAITLLPLHYSFGLSVLNTHCAAGASIIVSSASMMTRAFWDACENNEVTSLYGVPYHFELLKKLKFSRICSKLPKLSLMAQAGGKLSSDLKKEFHNIGAKNNFKFFTMYGQTEASARIACLQHKDFKHSPDSIGQVVPSGRIEIDPLEGCETGEIVFKGPNVCLGYASCIEDLALPDQNKGVLKTGDIGYLDKDGYLYITGRIKRIVKIFGNRVNLEHFEDIVKTFCQESIVIGDDSRIHVITTSGKKDSLMNHIQAQVSLPASCIVIKCVPAIKRTSSGKVDYQAVKESLKINEFENAPV